MKMYLLSRSCTVVRLTIAPLPFSISIKQCNNLIKNLPPIMNISCRQQSVLPPLKREKITNNIQLKTIQEECDGPRPLILLFGWLLAKQRHLDKYCNLYHSKGFDVLSLQMRPSQVLVPHRAQRTVERLLSVLEDSRISQKPLMVHGFSVGGYMYGECLVTLSRQKDRYQNIRDRMVGQIFDSPVDFEGVAPGFANVLMKNKVGQSVLRSCIEGYLNLFKGPITSHYIRASEAFHDNEMRLPSLVLYSKTDPIGVAERIEEVIRKWIREGIPVDFRCWESSPHVSHFHRHPDEYVDAVLAFLKSTGLTKLENQGIKEARAL